MSDSAPFIPFAVPDIGDAEVSAVAETVRSGWLTTGPQAAAFEQEFAEVLGGGVHALAVSSATAGLHLALEALGLRPGDEVLVPTWTFTATAEVVAYLGATPVLVDVDPRTLCLDLADAEAKVTSRTRAVMPVHFAGLAVPPSQLRAFADRHDLHVVEDAAHAFPTRAEGSLIGSDPRDLAVFSFYATKTMTTGEGGMVVTRDESIAARMRTMRLHGISRDVFDRYRSRKPSWQYEVVAPGFKYNLTDPAAAMGRVQLQRAEQMRAAREAIAMRYLEAFADLPVVLPATADANDVHAWHLFVVRVTDDSPLDRDQLVQALADRGVGTSVHFIPLHLHPYWASACSVAGQDLPVATREFPTALSLPLWSGLSAGQVDRVIEAVRSCLA